jgi:phosphoserine phosphatase
VVFDFDKTLTDTDTLWGFYREVDGNSPVFALKRSLLLLSAFLYKARVINNTQLKRVGVRLFLKGKSRDYLSERAVGYARKIQLNDIYTNHFLATPKEKRWIVSASFELYLQTLFPEEKVVGSSLRFNNEKVSGLEENMYGEKKRYALEERGIDKIECLFTDSYSDRPLMNIAKETNIIKDGIIISDTHHE